LPAPRTGIAREFAMDVPINPPGRRVICPFEEDPAGKI
jgi:hypothetical protein